MIMYVRRIKMNDQKAEIKKDVIPVALANMQKLCSDLEVKAVGLAREVRQSAEAYEQEQEDRKREAESVIYDLAQKRRDILKESQSCS